MTMIKLANGSQVTIDEFLTWSAHKQYSTNQSVATRNKRTNSLKAHWANNVKAPTRLGAKHTAETLEKMRLAHLGKPKSAEHKAKLSAAGLGRKDSAETCAKRSASLSTPVMTPHGLFPSVRAVVEASGAHSRKVRWWMEKYPEHYYYIPKDTK